MWERGSWLKVNPHAKGLLRLEGSVALSQRRVRDHAATFPRGAARLRSCSLCTAADAGGRDGFAVSSTPPTLQSLEVKSIPAVFNKIKFKLNIPGDKWEGGGVVKYWEAHSRPPSTSFQPQTTRV